MFQSSLDATNYAVVDTETSGVSRRDVVIQCAVGLYDEHGTELSHYAEYWQLAPGVEVNPRAQEVHHITPETLETRGLEPTREIAALAELLAGLEARNVPIVAHNASFDARLLSQTAAAWGVPWNDTSFFCTMKAALPHVGLLNKSGRPKMPSNAECYRFLFDRDPDNIDRAHDALMCATHARTHARTCTP